MADIDRIANRPRAYLAGTGLPQMTSGAVFFILGSFALIQIRLMQTPEYRDYGLVAQWVGIFCAGAVMWSGAVMRRRMVFPRGGYVQLSDGNRKILSAAAVVLAGMTVALLASRWPEMRLYRDSRLVAPSFAIAFALICFFSFWKEQRLSVSGSGLYLLCLAPLLYWMPGENYTRISTFEMAAGAPLAISGAIRLKRFLRANPIVVETPDE